MACDRELGTAASHERILAAAGKPWHKVLGLTVAAVAEDVQKAYKQLALLHHPDKPQGDADTFRRVREAYSLGLRKCKKFKFGEEAQKVSEAPAQQEEPAPAEEPGDVGKTAKGKAKAKGKGKGKAKAKMETSDREGG